MFGVKREARLRCYECSGILICDDVNRYRWDAALAHSASPALCRPRMTLLQTRSVASGHPGVLHGVPPRGVPWGKSHECSEIARMIPLNSCRQRGYSQIRVRKGLKAPLSLDTAF